MPPNVLLVACEWGLERPLFSIIKTLDKDTLQNTTNRNGQTALHIAALHGYETIARKLIEAGLDVNARQDKSGTALQAASFGGHDQLIRILVDKGADVNALGGQYGTALQAASSKGYKQII